MNAPIEVISPRSDPHRAVFKTFGEHCCDGFYTEAIQRIPDVENVSDLFFFSFCRPTALCLHHKLLDCQTTTMVH